MLPAALFCCGEESFKAKAAGGLTGNTQGCDHSAGTGNGADNNTGFMTQLYQILAGVRDGGAAGIGYQRAGFAGQNPFDYFFAFKSLVMLIVADKAFFDAQVIQKL